ncbi:flagellar type III secretion system pore protein FliP [Parendozoicomonas haliclonae]|uniref:Flagellar biosynthetic protein FliP n=1 Tax=Parendozoicomonas haliclonae TaxID=1960125 RepID=A0A1X7AP18_9GAMM|nr:flagellar type III secretion system pore protein FliP [Parendozoicomonas haliclonae]SMA49893.1 Flagellar biosynthetic protein FliP precursor [Parendozoicomonas haliclonae]
MSLRMALSGTGLLAALWLLLFSPLSFAAPPGADPSLVSLGGLMQLSPDAGADELASPLRILILLTVLSLAPAILMMLTAFTRIVIVLSMLRQAIGMPQTPPNSVLISLALILTLYTMMPVFEAINDKALVPWQAGEISTLEAASAAEQPVKAFLISQTREQDLALILELSDKPVPDSASALPLSTLVPAFLLSELQIAFQIGFIIFLPFLMIDLIVSSILMSVGMIMLPPMTISLPVKVLMFVLIEGWALVAYALVGSFQ